MLLVACLVLETFINSGEWDFVYLYLRRVLGFNMTQFARYNAFLGVIGCVAQVL